MQILSKDISQWRVYEYHNELDETVTMWATIVYQHDFMTIAP